MHVIENLPNVVLESVCLRLQGYEKYQLDLQIVFFLTFFLAKTYFTESSKKMTVSLFYLNMMLNLGIFTNIKVVKFDLSESDIFIT